MLQCCVLFVVTIVFDRPLLFPNDLGHVVDARLAVESSGTVSSCVFWLTGGVFLLLCSHWLLMLHVSSRNSVQVLRVLKCSACYTINSPTCDLSIIRYNMVSMVCGVSIFAAPRFYIHPELSVVSMSPRFRSLCLLLINSPSFDSS